MKAICVRFLMFCALLNCASAPAKTPAVPPPITISFTDVPRHGHGPASRGDIAGFVKNLASPAQYKIVLYAHTDKWYVQPLASDPFTDIAADGLWSNWTHLGHRYAALVVRPQFQPPEITQALPTVGGLVVAKAEIPASEQ